MLPSYSFIDASTGDYQEEEVFYQEEEEEYFDHFTNQGKLIPLQASLLQADINITPTSKLTFLQARLMQANKLANPQGAKLY